MRPVFSLSLTSLAAALMLAAAGAAGGETARAWIETARGQDSVTLSVFATLGPGMGGRYELVARKSGSSGSATTRQAGRVPADAGAGPFTTTRLSLGAGERIVAELTVTAGDGRVHADRVEIGPE